MKHRILLPILTALLALCVSSCVDPYYYDDSTTFSASASYTTLPHGYQTVYVSGIPYYYCGSRWYRRSGSHYIVCSRPYGYYGHLGRSYHHYSISRLPYGCRTTYVGGHRYYNHGDKWYRKSGSGYVACSKPKGDSKHKHQKYHASSKHQGHEHKAHGDKKKHKTKTHNGDHQKDGDKCTQLVKHKQKQPGNHASKSDSPVKKTSYPVSLTKQPGKTLKTSSSSKKAQHKARQKSTHPPKKSMKSSRSKQSSKNKKNR